MFDLIFVLVSANSALALLASQTPSAVIHTGRTANSAHLCAGRADALCHCTLMRTYVATQRYTKYISALFEMLTYVRYC